MPKKNGFQVCRDIKSNEQYKHIPVIMVTSKDQESDKFWGMKQGADEYLTKPFKPEDLVKAVKKYI
jgi:DNA-binding response OmpR family regulator